MSMMRPTAHCVASILATQLDIARERIVPTACLFADLRALPLALVRASIALEDAFAIVIPDDALAKVRTVEDFMALVARHSHPQAPRARSSRRMRRGRWA